MIKERDDKLANWIKTQPENLPINKLRKIVKNWWKEIDNARKLSDENDHRLPREELLFVYTFMNEFSVWRSLALSEAAYIKKLESTLKIYRKKIKT